MLRSWLAVLALSSALAGEALAAPPPPPPPPPEEIPAQVDGYSTGPIWSGYMTWLYARMGAARAIVIAQRPAILAESYSRAQSGPSVRAYSGEPGGEMFGGDERIDQWCSTQASENNRCVWVASYASSVGGVMPQVYARAHFDAQRAVAFLREQGIAPDDPRIRYPQSYGLPDPLDDDPARYVVIRYARDDDCPAVSVALDRAAAARADVLAAQAAEHGPPPPSAPHAGIVIITLPDTSGNAADVVASDRGPGSPAEGLARSIFAPIEHCWRVTN